MTNNLPDLPTVIAALEHCAPGTDSCDGCPMKNSCVGISNPAMAAAAAYLRKQVPRQLPVDKIREHIQNPLYIVTPDGGVDTWAFYMAYVDRSGTYIWRGMDDQIHAFHTNEYGKEWLCFTARINDKTWENIEWK